MVMLSEAVVVAMQQVLLSLLRMSLESENAGRESIAGKVVRGRRNWTSEDEEREKEVNGDGESVDTLFFDGFERR